jgi:RNA polymerase sigma-70 factor (ECF subfamily)
MEDEQLLQEVGAGNRQAFRELFKRYYGPLSGFAKKMTGRKADVEEMVQEIMVRIWTRAPLFDSEKGRAKPWIYKVAGRVILNWLDLKREKEKKFEVSFPENFENRFPTSERSAEEVAVRVSEAEMVLKALARIPDDLRMAVTMRHLEGLSIEEIAEVMECPEGTAKSRIFNGLRKLREILDKEVERVEANKM